MPLPDRIAGAAADVFRRVKGSYSVVAIVANIGLVAFRDPFGIKPLIMGERKLPSGERSVAFASESVVLDLLDYREARDLRAGEVIFVDLDREIHSRQAAAANHHPCIFEYVYFARPDSFLDRVSVYKTRLRLGEALGQEWLKTGITPDVVIPIPESARPAATSLARVLGVPYREGLVKNRYIGRTFIMPGQKERQSSVRRKLNPIRVEFEGKDVLLVDDSIVRGTTCRQIIQIARSAGAKKVYFASYSPALRFPCVYGIDMQTRHEFIARGRDPHEIARLIGADHLLYQPLEQLVEAAKVGNPAVGQFCTACFSGDYPTGDITPEMFAEIEEERVGAHSDAG
jgi:amidophosphoribosyltransferase